MIFYDFECVCCLFDKVDGGSDVVCLCILIFMFECVLDVSWFVVVLLEVIGFNVIVEMEIDWLEYVC